MESHLSIEPLQCVPPAWRIGDKFFFSPVCLFFIFITLLCRWLHNGADCPEKLWSLPHWRYSWTIWDAILCHMLWEDPAWTGRLDQKESFLSLPIPWITLAMPDSCYFPYNHCPINKEREEVWNSSNQHNLLHTLSTVQFADGGIWDGIGMFWLVWVFWRVFICVSLHRRLFLASFSPGVKDTTWVLNGLERMIRRVNIGRIWWESRWQK